MRNIHAVIINIAAIHIDENYYLDYTDLDKSNIIHATFLSDFYVSGGISAIDDGIQTFKCF